MMDLIRYGLGWNGSYLLIRHAKRRLRSYDDGDLFGATKLHDKVASIMPQLVLKSTFGSLLRYLVRQDFDAWDVMRNWQAPSKDQKISKEKRGKCQHFRQYRCAHIS